MRKDYRYIILYTGAAAVLIWLLDVAFDALLSRGTPLSDLYSLNAPFRGVVLRLLLAVMVAAGLLGYLRSLRVRSRERKEIVKHLTAIETSMDGIAIYDKDGRYQYVNQAYARINGYERPDELIGHTFELVYGDAQACWMVQNILPELKRAGRWQGELRARRKDGSSYHQESSVTMLEDGGRVCVVRDITERKEREEKLRSSERFLSSVFDSIRDPFCIIDRNFVIVRANEAYLRLKNKAGADLTGERCYEALEGRVSVCPGCVIEKSLNSKDPCAKEKMIRLADGGELWVEIYTYPVLDDDGAVSHVIEYTRDVTERRRAEEDRRRLIERLDYLSKVDGLTGLLNRRALTEHLGYEIERARRFGDELCVILCDVDNLKQVNDTAGHRAGDLALQAVAGTLKESLRQVDLAGRYGGDEFLVIAPHTHLGGAEKLAEKIRAGVGETPLAFDHGAAVRISLSAGVAALGPTDDMDALVKRADAALYVSKHGGRNRVTAAS